MGPGGVGGVDIKNEAEELHGGEGEGQRVSGRSRSRSLGGWGAFWKRKSGLRLPSSAPTSCQERTGVYHQEAVTMSLRVLIH